MRHGEQGWLLFLLAEASAQGAGRARVWRALKTLGSAVIRDGVYLLPQRVDIERELAEQQTEVRRGGGQAFIFSTPTAGSDTPLLQALFDRTAEFSAVAEGARQFLNGDSKLNEADARRALRSLQRDLAALVATDYFPNFAQDEARVALAAAEETFLQRFSPGEPHAASRAIVRLNREDYQNRVWATRQRLWVDRIASAWLIKRWIDERARFRWLKNPTDCPKDAIGFDFDGATFSHVGELVTFEVLLRAFALDADPALLRIATMVHALDVPGSIYSPEAAGFEMLLGGARERCTSDDDLVTVIFPPLDFLYAGFAREAVAR
jgi:hypothetical protein